ncbi:hypothetical protein OG788_43970 [Streptomyces sp. NBC_00647]|uniref:hypothetical protein n=1 Tax=Streptomyces sp. NBC_00647 TaxID=2975796 RepID=UPI00324F4EAB
MITPSRRPSIPTRLLNGRICAYDLSPDLRGVLAPTAEFRPLPDDEVKSHTVFADLERAVYTTLNSVVCAAADGTELWRSDLRPLSDRLHGHWPGCALSLDEREVWVYRPTRWLGATDRTGGSYWTPERAPPSPVPTWRPSGTAASSTGTPRTATFSWT